MQKDVAFDRMAGFHERLRALLDESHDALGAEAIDSAAMAGLRWRFVRTLREYQLFKHTEIFDPVMRAGEASRAEAASAMKDRCIAMGDAYSDHVRRWTLVGSGPTAPGYAADARRMTRQIADHLLREEAGIRRLLTGVERTRRPALG